MEMKNLKVTNIYTTSDEASSSYGAMTLNCEADGIPVTVRTEVLFDANKELVTEEVYKDKTIDVKGIVDYFNGEYQIKVFSVNDIVIR